MNLGRTGILLALLLSFSMIATVIPAGSSAYDIPASTTFFTEEVEQPTFAEWDERWSKTDMNPESSLDYWCRSTHEYYAGTHSAYCARSGYNSNYWNSSNNYPFNYNVLGAATGTPPVDLVQRYDTDMDAIMRKYVSGAGYYNTITLSFWFYSDTGTSDAKQPLTGTTVGYDFLNVIYYTGSNNSLTKHVAWTDTQQQAFAKTWTHESVVIPNNATWVGFEFVSGTVPPEGGDASNAFTAYGVSTYPSGSSGMKEGVYLDSIRCIGTEPVDGLPVVTSVINLPAYQSSLSFNVSFVDNDPLGLNLEWTYLYYRINGIGSWTKYTTEQKPMGAFVSSPIAFTATQNGLYEFFTQGKDLNGTLEEKRDAADAFTLVDTVDPSTYMSVIGDQRGEDYMGAAAFTLTAEDDSSGIAQTLYRVDGGETKVYTGSVGLATTGTHIVDYYSIDNASNVEDVRNATIRISAGSPSIVFLEQEKTYPDGNVTVTFTVADAAAVSNLEYSLDGGSFVELDTNATSISFHGLEDGGHSVTVRATDMEGGIIENVVNFTVGSATPEVLGLSIDDPLVLAGLVSGCIIIIGGVAWFMRRKR